MASEKYYSAMHAKGQFHCPHCGVFAKQRWAHLTASEDLHTTYFRPGVPDHKSNVFNLAKVNNAVHPGGLDLTDDVERVSKLFGLMNFIVDKMITEPKELQAFYDELPEEAKKAIEKRDHKPR
jgi:hypothetical protein